MKTSSNPLRDIPIDTFLRIPGYLSVLRSFQQQSRDYVSINRISGCMALQPFVIANDFEYLGIPDVCNGIHEVKSLINKIEQNLEVKENKALAFMAGISPHIRDIIQEKYLENPEFNVVAIFDKNPVTPGTTLLGIPILDSSRLITLAQRLKVTRGILSSTPEDADYYYHLMVQAGILMIRNHSGKDFEPANGCSMINIATFYKNDNSNK
ncbi:MAG: winged-helix domain-containing protein [Bacteroidota bacterium]|nr:winged-helix domain-containing protein [Bacteroidota bacterium]